MCLHEIRGAIYEVCENPFCFVVCCLKLPKSFIALRSKEWSQILFNVGFLQEEKQGGEERNRVLREEEVMEEEK